MKQSLFVLSLVTLLGTSSVFASGFRCEGEGGYRVKVFNHVDPKLGTRTPAHLIISHEDQGTLLHATTADIEKINHPGHVEYQVMGEARSPFIEASLNVDFNEGSETIEAGQLVDATLILTDVTHSKDYYSLVCNRYLKGNQ